MKALFLFLLLAACIPLPGSTGSRTPELQKMYEYQMGYLVRAWNETVTVDKLAFCRDYFADPEAVYVYLYEFFGGKLLRSVFDDFTVDVCKLVPVMPANPAG